MKKLAVLAMVALAFGACSDTMTSPQADPGEAVFSNHVVQSGGNGRSYHGYTAPTFDAVVTGDDVQLCASWTDEWLPNNPAVAGVSTRHFSFDFQVSTDDGATWGWWGEGVDHASANGDVNGDDGCLTVSDLEDGTYLFRAKGIAHYGQGDAATNHHTLFAFEEVTVGGVVYTIEILSVNGNGTSFSNANGTFTFKKQGDFSFQVALFADGVEVECTIANANVEGTASATLPSVSAGTATAALGCAYHGNTDRWRYSFSLTNPLNNTVSTGSVTFTVNGQATSNSFTYSTIN